MKSVEIQKREKYDDRVTLAQVCGMHMEGGITVGQMRLLVKILDKVEALPKEGPTQLLLEDTEHEALLRVYNGFRFGIAHRDMIALHDAIEKAPTA